MATIYPLLKPHDWAHKDLVAHRLISDKVPGIPLVAFGFDAGDNYQCVLAKDVDDIDRLNEEALGNLAALRYPWELGDSHGLRYAASSGNEFSAEQVLCPSAMLTLKKLPSGNATGLESLFASVWPAESFHTGTVELFGPDRINQEHDALIPGCVAIQNGFLGIGGNGGNLFSYCIADGKVYFLESDYFSEEAVYARPWQRMDISPENIKATTTESWSSLTSFLEWAISELAKLETGDQSPA